MIILILAAAIVGGAMLYIVFTAKNEDGSDYFDPTDTDIL